MVKAKSQKGTSEKIRSIALELLGQHKEGINFSKLKNMIIERDPVLNNNTIRGAIWDLDATFPEKVCKPARGLFRLVDFSKNTDIKDTVSEIEESDFCDSEIKKHCESDFYQPFADYLQNEIEEVTHAHVLGGNVFGQKWGTPDVIGKKESKRSDIIKGNVEIVSSEIKTNTDQLITAFGQACAYKIFSHKVYLVVPQQFSRDDRDRLDSLCQICGIGLIMFDSTSPSNPNFSILVRALKHEPDLFYTNMNMAKIEKKLFS
ncbi:MAG: hypothetical protein HQL74_07745 [Magnetococcales bacterium]|nr:hypothetical protein [Magnetococcales bacterium]